MVKQSWFGGLQIGLEAPNWNRSHWYSFQNCIFLTKSWRKTVITNGGKFKQAECCIIKLNMPMQWKFGEKCWDLYPEGHLNNIGVRQKISPHKINNFIYKTLAKEEGQGLARSMKSKTAATIIGGPKTFWEDQRAGGLKKVANVNFLQFLLSTVRGRFQGPGPVKRSCFQIWIISAEKRPYPRPS